MAQPHAEVVVLVGVPGSGKTTLARSLASAYPWSAIVSADDHFIGRDGQYRYIASEVGLAHIKCLQAFSNALRFRRSPIIVDNTNTKREDIAPYMKLAAEADYEARIIRVNCDPADAFERQRHNVPPEAFARLLERFNQRDYEPTWRVLDSWPEKTTPTLT